MASLLVETGVQISSQPPVEEKEDLQANQTGLPFAPEVEEPPSIVPSKRTTVFDCFLLVKKVDDPKSYSRRFRWFITILAAASAALDPLSSTIFYRAALPQLPVELGTTESIANLSVALTFIGPAIMPVYWSYIAERWGRRTVYIVSLFLYVIFTALSASSTSISMLIAMRVLGSTCSGTVAGAAVISDIWEVKEKGHAMSIYYIGPLGGSAIGPVIGGLLTQAWTWRASLWFLTIYAGLVLLLLFFYLPETYKRPAQIPIKTRVDSVLSESDDNNVPVRLQRRCVQVKVIVQSLGELLKRPLQTLAFLRFPLIDVTLYLSSISYGVIIMVAVSTQQAFNLPPYQFNPIIIGLLYLPRSVGVILGSLVCGRWSDHIMNREAKRLGRYDEKGRIVHVPEERMRENIWVSLAIVPIAILWFGWTMEYGLFWVIPTTSTFFFGFGTGLIFGLVSTMVTEYIPRRSASMVALNSLGRNVFAAIGGAVTQPLLSDLGNGWVYTGVSVIFTVNVLAVFTIRRNGRRWREDIDRTMGIDRFKIDRRVTPHTAGQGNPALPGTVMSQIDSRQTFADGVPISSSVQSARTNQIS